MYLSGFLVGIVFGIIVKRARFCGIGLIRDVYIEKRCYNFIIILSIIAIEGAIYYGLGNAGFIVIPPYLPPFSLLSVAVGSFLFGVGASLANGCLCTTLIKCGDGRIVGFTSLAAFMLSGYFVSGGPGKMVSARLRSHAVVSDALDIRLSSEIFYIFCIIAFVLCICMIIHHKRHKPIFTIPGSYTGVKHVILEKVFSPEFGAIMIGAWLGLAFLFSEAYGRHNGIALATPVLSWVYEILKPSYIIGGCNPFDRRIGWGSFLVLGIIIGSFAASSLSREFSIVKPPRNILFRSIIGGLLMGVGAMWGQGCFTVNGLVGTAQLSLKSWYAFIFIILGVWSYHFAARKGRKYNG